MAPDPRRQTMALIVLAILFGGVFVGGAVHVYSQQHSGEVVTVTVVDCQQGRRSLACYGTWSRQDGTVVSGIVEGANSGHVGQELDARSSGDRAYLPSLRLPIILLVLGLALPAGAVWEAARARRASAPLPEPAR